MLKVRLMNTKCSVKTNILKNCFGIKSCDPSNLHHLIRRAYWVWLSTRCIRTVVGIVHPEPGHPGASWGRRIRFCQCIIIMITCYVWSLCIPGFNPGKLPYILHHKVCTMNCWPLFCLVILTLSVIVGVT